MYLDDSTEDEGRKRGEAFARAWQNRQAALNGQANRQSVHQPINLVVHVKAEPQEPPVVNVSRTPVTVNVSPTPITVQPAPVTVQSQPQSKKIFTIERTEPGKMVGRIKPTD